MAGDQTVLGGRYEVGELLGRGGMAEVRRGVDTRLGRPVAIKQLVGPLAADSVCQARFKREALSAASLSHPAIVSVFDTGQCVGADSTAAAPYLVMELVEGRTLKAALADGEKMLPDRALELTKGVLDALGHSHDAGIVHRDIKPANVMLTSTGEVKVMDFGIARAVADTSTNLTQTATVVGTAHYLSPEQARGEKVDHRTDLYSAGCLLYELLVGRPPFVGESVLSVVYQHVREEPVPPSQLDASVSAEIEAVVLKSLAKDPAERYQSARDMRSDIDQVLAGQQPAAAAVPPPVAEPPVAASDPGTSPTPAVYVPRRAKTEERSRRRGVAIALVMALLLLGLGGYGFTRNQTPTAASARMVPVPDVLGSSRNEAVQTIRDAGLEPRVREVPAAGDGPVNTVVKQGPLGGVGAQAQSVVTLDVSVAAKKAQIPSGLVGRDIETVREKLKAAGFGQIFAVEAKDQPADAQAGEVVSIDPGEGESVNTTQQIVLNVATGGTGPRATGDESNSSDEQSSDQQGSDQQTSGQQGPGTQDPNQQGPDKQDPNQQDPDKQDPNQQDSDQPVSRGARPDQQWPAAPKPGGQQTDAPRSDGSAGGQAPAKPGSQKTADKAPPARPKEPATRPTQTAQPPSVGRPEPVRPAPTRTRSQPVQPEEDGAEPEEDGDEGRADKTKKPKADRGDGRGQDEGKRSRGKGRDEDGDDDRGNRFDRD